MKIKISENLRVLFLFFVLGLLGKILMQGKIESRRKRAEGKGHERGRDGWVASSNQWTWVWVNSGRWRTTRMPGVLQFMRSQRVGHDLATEPLLLLLIHFTHVWLCATLWTAAHQDTLSLGFFRQDYWLGCHSILQCMHACMLSRLSRVWLCATLWTAAHQAPLSMGFSRKEYWSGGLPWWCSG